MSKVDIWEVGPRDGLQNEKKSLSVQDRVKLVQSLVDAGLKKIEVGAFVSPKWVPQMKDSAQVVEKLGAPEAKVVFSALVPNVRGMEDAIASGIKEVAIFGACSESFSKKNINCSIDESVTRFKEVIALAKKNKVRVRGYLSTVFGCPYEGPVSQTQVIKLVEKYLQLGVYQVSLGDTIGVATPKPVREMLSQLKSRGLLNKVAMHFHNTRGTALANVLASVDSGVKTFDASVGGMGGCPYAKGASGNLATEDLVYMLEGMGFNTGIDLKKLVAIKKAMEEKLERPLPSHVGESGPWL